METIHKTYAVSWVVAPCLGLWTDEAIKRAINSRLGRADNTRFLERFRYIIVASQLLSTHSYLGQAVHTPSRDPNVASRRIQRRGASTLAGALVTVCFVFSLVWLMKWVIDGRYGMIRMGIALIVLLGLGFIFQAYMRRQWLHYLRQQALLETSEFVAKAQEFDQIAAAAITLVQEVELVSRGYRM